MKIAIATDAWRPLVNGVVTTLEQTSAAMESMGHTVLRLTPEPFRTIPLPTYPEIRLAISPSKKIRQSLDTFQPDAVHIATEGPIGLSTRAYCISRKILFTTSYHTQFPQYVRLRVPIPLCISYFYLRWFHSRAERVMVPTESIRKELKRRKFKNVEIWSRGVNTTLFRPRDKTFLDGPRPISMYVGRVAVEKNIEAFLTLQTEGIKYVVGDGPDLGMLRARYPQVRFVGYKYGKQLAQHIAAADVFVFPSRTDTFGLVMLEAMACGVPVAAYPVTGPVDVVKHGVTGILDENLEHAVRGALRLDGRVARAYAETRSWRAATIELLKHLAINERPSLVEQSTESS